MSRMIAFGMIAAASLALAALTPSAASAHGPGFHHNGWHGGWHSGWHGHTVFGPALYVGGLTDSCLQRRVVETRRGPRVRTVNVCAY